jgi:tetratricopeptide (TPR) repeat protein
MTALLLLLMLQAAPLPDARKAMARGDYAAARAAISRALAAAPNDPAARFLSGFLYYLENELPRAIPELEQAARLNPADSRPKLYLAMSLESVGRTAEAEAEYKRAVALVEKNPKGEAETHLAYARYLMVAGNLDGAGQLIARSLIIAPNSRDVHFENARLLLRLNRPREALAAAERSLRCQPGGIPEDQVRYVLSRARSLAAAETGAK